MGDSQVRSISDVMALIDSVRKMGATEVTVCDVTVRFAPAPQRSAPTARPRVDDAERRIALARAAELDSV
jgi:hypothetical protein